jgi:hypothetical protein
MKVKDFFKSTAFKCIAVLLVIVIICGVFLTICNSIFFVSSEEKLQRAISKIYGEEINLTEYGEYSSSSNYYAIDDAEIEGVYLVTKNDDAGKLTINDYLVLSQGSGGNAGGTVTCWVAVKMSDNLKSITGIRKISVSSNEKQDYIADVTGNADYLNSFGEKYTDGIVYSTSAPADKPDLAFVVSGATKTSNAVNNSVNGAISFVKTIILGQAATADPFEGFEYTAKINTKSGTSFTVDGETVNYTIKTKSLDGPNPFTVEISVAKNSDGKAAITSYKITKNGSSEDIYENSMYNFATNMVGKTADELLALINTADGTYSHDAIDGTFKTGATESNYLCAAAGLFATANYDKAIGGNS